MMPVEVANHHGWESVLLEQIWGSDSSKGGRLEREIVGVDDPEPSELKVKKPSGANMSMENKSERMDAPGRSAPELSRWGCM